MYKDSVLRLNQMLNVFEGYCFDDQAVISIMSLFVGCFHLDVVFDTAMVC